MRAMVLAAGLGTRLMPLTENTPKALVPFKGIPLLERVMRNLAGAGITEVMVNVHHYPEQVIDFLDRMEIPGLSISVSDESAELMNTGGALLQARDFLSRDENFLVHNVDVITDLDIRSLIRQHEGDSALVTIAVKKRITSRSLLFDESDRLSGWRQNETGEEKIVRQYAGKLKDYGNSCIQVINRHFLEFFTGTEALNLTEMYLGLAGEQIIRPYVHNRDYWYDLGRYSNFLIADKEVF